MRSASRRSTIGDVARALVGMGADCVITDAPDVILRGAGRARRPI